MLTPFVGTVRGRAAAFGSIAMLFVTIAAIAGRQGGAASAEGGADNSFSTTVKPFVAQYCSDCHSGPTPEAKLDLAEYRDVRPVVRDRKVWRKVLFKLEAAEMPPADAPFEPRSAHSFGRRR